MTGGVNFRRRMARNITSTVTIKFLCLFYEKWGPLPPPPPRNFLAPPLKFNPLWTKIYPAQCTFTACSFFRKFADIGNTVQQQYLSPTLHLSSGWAELVTCHALPGPGVIDSLKNVVSSGTGGVLVVEMSTQGALTSPEYTKGCVYVL